MCVKLPPTDLNSGPYLPHLTSTYICKVTIIPWVCGCTISYTLLFFLEMKSDNLRNLNVDPLKMPSDFPK